MKITINITKKCLYVHSCIFVLIWNCYLRICMLIYIYIHMYLNHVFLTLYIYIDVCVCVSINYIIIYIYILERKTSTTVVGHSIHLFGFNSIFYLFSLWHPIDIFCVSLFVQGFRVGPKKNIDLFRTLSCHEKCHHWVSSWKALQPHPQHVDLPHRISALGARHVSTSVTGEVWRVEDRAGHWWRSPHNDWLLLVWAEKTSLIEGTNPWCLVWLACSADFSWDDFSFTRKCHWQPNSFVVGASLSIPLGSFWNFIVSIDVVEAVVFQDFREPMVVLS